MGLTLCRLVHVGRRGNDVTMKIILTALMTLAFMTAGSLSAQERSATGATDVQMTWTSLSNLVKAADDKATAVNSRVDQVVVCGKKGKNYAPEAPGADAEGCLEASSNNGTNLTTMLNTLNALNGNMANIISCGASGRTYNGTACVAPTGTVPTGTVCGVSSHSTESGRPLIFACNGVDPKNGCPAGYESAYLPIWGGRNGQSVSYCFKK